MGGRGGRTLAMIGACAPLLAGCLEIGRMTYRFDLATGRGMLVLEDIGTDDPTTADRDFASLVNEYILGSHVQDDHPRWRVGERRIFEAEGRLDGVVTFGFDRPEDAGLYQHDKKSAYLWCAADDETVVSTSGSVVPMYPDCVMFDRKAKVAEVTVTVGKEGGNRTTLLPQFRGWDGQSAVSTPDMALGTVGGLGDLSAGIEEVLRGAAGVETGGLGSLLPAEEASPAWKALGLPIAGSQIVFQSDHAYQANHTGESEAVVAAYDALLGAAGYTSTDRRPDGGVWTKGEEHVTVAVVRAGASVIVSLSR